MRSSDPITERDRFAMEAFSNWLSWGVTPAPRGELFIMHRPVPPAWFAHAMGLTSWCPPQGEM